MHTEVSHSLELATRAGSSSPAFGVCDDQNTLGLLQVGIACVNLTSLKAAGCPGLTLNSVAGFPMLRELDLSGCDCIAPATAVRMLIFCLQGCCCIVKPPPGGRMQERQLE